MFKLINLALEMFKLINPERSNKARNGEVTSLCFQDEGGMSRDDRLGNMKKRSLKCSAWWFLEENINGINGIWKKYQWLLACFFFTGF